MARKNWRRLRATSISHGMELCLAHASEKLNRSVDNVADLMGLPNRWQIYRWMENGRLPGILIRPFEAACGIDFVTQYIAHSGNRLLIDCPSGRKTTAHDIHKLQESCNTAIGCLIKFHEGKSNSETTISALVEAMQQLAWHKQNTEKTTQPEFDFQEEAK